GEDRHRGQEPPACPGPHRSPPSGPRRRRPVRAPEPSGPGTAPATLRARPDTSTGPRGMSPGPCARVPLRASVVPPDERLDQEPDTGQDEERDERRLQVDRQPEPDADDA